MNKIPNLRRLYWDNRTESYMFDGCMCSVMTALGEKRFDFDFFAALTGDFFTQMFDPARAVDSYTQDYFTPEIAVNAFSACGYACEVLEADAIAGDPEAAMTKVRASIDRGVPVIAHGIGETEAFSLIGGYEDNGAVDVNIWDAQEKADAQGYVRVETGFKGVKALIFAGEKAGEALLPEVFRTVLDSIVKCITRPGRGECRFGYQAYQAWADALLDDGNFSGTDDEVESVRARLHDAPLIMLVTNASGVRRIFARINADYPELGLVRLLAPVYAEVMSITAELLRVQDGFFVKPERMRDRVLREQLAGYLRRLADCMKQVYNVFCE